jgi:hypothetical protein
VTTALQVAATASNAAQSTGPKTSAGKARSSKNALRHGLRSELPVLPGERAEDWQAHRDGVVRSLAPAGALEIELAGRVAPCLWRLRRVTAFETGVTAAQVQEARAEPTVPPSDALSDLLNPGGTPLQKACKALQDKRRTMDLWKGSLVLLRRLNDVPEDAPTAGDDVYGALEEIGGELPGAEDEYFDLEDRAFLAGLGIPPR